MITLRLVKPILFLVVFLFAFCLSTQTGESFPVGDAFNKKQDAPFPSPHDGNETTTPVYKSLQPALTDQYNEPHPFPEYIKKYGQEDKLPDLYRQLILMEPADHVQSKIFDEKAFKEIKKIGVMGFENKTYAPYASANAGDVVTNQAFTELTTTTYTVISPLEMNEIIYKLKIVATPSKKTQTDKKEQATAQKQQEPEKLPFTTKDMDGVLVGAVTKFMDTYKNERGEIKPSLSSGVEFGVYLISTKTGNVVWGARYVGTQPVNLINTLKGEQGLTWLKKDELSHVAMKKVLKVFHESGGQTQQDIVPISEK